MYNINIKKVVGSCDNKLLNKMLVQGDISFLPFKDYVNTNVIVTGYMIYEGIYEEQHNDYLLVATDVGYFRTGSKLIKENLLSYIEEVNHFIIREIITNKGKTYKFEPIL